MLARWRNKVVAGACAVGLGLLLLAVFAAPTLAAEPAVEMYHAVLVGGQPGELNVSERLIFSGLEGRKDPLEIPLPAGATDVRIADGTLKGEVREGKVVIPGPFTTEEPNLALSYRLSSTSPHFDLSRAFPWPVKTFLLLTPQADLVVSGPQVSPAGDFPVGGTNYRAFLAENVPAKEKLELLVTLGVATADQERGEAGTGFWQQLPLGKATPYLFAAVVAVVAVALVLSRRRSRTMEAERLEAEENAFRRLRAEEQVLLRRLQELEEKYSQQKIDRETYERLQEEYKSRLIKVRANLRHLT